MDQSVEEQTVDIVPPTVDTLSPSNPQRVDNSQDIVVERTNPDTGVNEETMRFSVVPPKQEAPTVSPENPESQSLPHQPEPTQDVPKHAGGRPCGYCKDKEEINKKVAAYLERCSKGADGKPIMPFLEELCLELDIDEDTMSNWANKMTKEEELEHPQFFGAYKKIRMYQKLRLQQRTMGRYNPSGAIFLLKANHGLMESEKRILAGDAKTPLEIVLTEERKLPGA